MTDETVLVELHEVTFGVLEDSDDVVTIVATDLFGVGSGGSGSGGTDLTVKEEGSAVDTAVASLNFVGGSQTAAQTASGAVTVTSTAYYPGGTDVPVTDGGTGASDASTARTNLGLGSIATQASSSVSITGGSITGITDLAVADGGTGASTAAGARTNLGVVQTFAGTGGDDTAALQAVLDAYSAVRITGTVLVSSTIKLNVGQELFGDTHRTSIIKLANGSNLTGPIICSKNYTAHTGVSNPLNVRDIAIDGNKANNSGTADGIVIFAWLSTVQDCHVYNCTGNGIVFTDADDAGTYIATSGQNVENRILRNRVQTCDGRGIYVWEQSGDGNLTDGFCVDNIVNSCALDGILIQRGAGWQIIGNHTYTGTGLGTMGIRVQRCFSTRITGNYVDNYGQTASTGFYSGIRAEIHDVRGSVIANNTISCTEDTAGSTYRHLYVLASTSITDARAVVAGNVIVGTSASNGTGIRIEAPSGTNLSAHVYGNKVDSCNTSFTGVATGTLTGRFDLYGSGSPESAITAPIGATWTRSDGSTSTTLYVKESGTGNTGWVAVGASGVTSVGGNTGAITDAQLLASIKNVDGAGSGLDADTLDGNDASAFLTSSSISDTAYDATSWNGVTTVAPSKNAVRDKIEALSSTYQPLDADLTTIAGLTATTDNFIQSKSSAWASRTPAQVGVDIGTAHHMRGTYAAMPAASSSNAGYLYATSDTLAVYESDGSAWNKIADIGSLPRFGGITAFGHSYTQTAGNKAALAIGGDTFGNFTHRVAALLNISADEVNLNGKSGGQLTTASAGDSTDMQGTGAVFRHIYPNHWYGAGGSVSYSDSRSWPGLFLFCYGLNDVGRIYTDASGVCLTAYTHGVRAITSRACASQLYNAGVRLDSTIVLTTGFGSTVTDTGYTGGAYRKSTANSDVFTITLPSDFRGGTVAVCLVGGTNTQTYATTISSTSTTSITLTDLGSTSGHTAIANGDVIQIDNEQMLVTAGGGTTSITVTRGVNSTTAATHSNNAVVRLAANTAKVTWSGTASAATGTTTTAGQGAAGSTLAIRSTIPIVKRFALTADDAGKTIIGTVSGITTSSTEFVALDSWWVEDPAPPTVLWINQPNGIFGSMLPGVAWTRARATTYNGVLTTIAAEFTAGNVSVVDIATPFDSLFYATTQASIATSGATTIHVTPSDATNNVIGKGSYLRIESEEMLVTAITKTSDTDWSLTVTRGVNGTSAAAHTTVGTAIYDARAWSADRTHPSDHGHVLYAKYIFNTLTTLSQSADQRANSGGLVVRRNWRMAEGQVIPGSFYNGSTKAAATIGTLYIDAFYLPEPAVLTQLSANVTAATNASGLLRFGVWTDGPGGPQTLLVDSRVYTGVDLTQGSTGERTAAVFLPLKPGWYWKGVAMQGTGTMATMRTIAGGPTTDYPYNNVNAGVISANLMGWTIGGYTVSGQTGALGNFTGLSSAFDSLQSPIVTFAKFSVPVRD